MEVEQNSIAVVTGAGSGIGKAAAIQLATQFFYVAVIDINKERALETVEHIYKAGGKAIAIEVDVQKEEEVEAAFKKIVEQWQVPIRAVFANAGVNGVFSAIEHMEIKDWDQTLNINLRGTFLTTKHAIPYLKEAGGGSIVITSSINGNRKYVGAGMSAYSASKAGQVAFMKMAAVELGRYKIRVNAICPGAIETNIGENTHIQENVDEIRIPIKYPEGVPFEGKGTPEQVADVVGFLCSEKASHVSGVEMYVDGSQSLI